jgi:hypothetical protein
MQKMPIFRFIWVLHFTFVLYPRYIYRNLFSCKVLSEAPILTQPYDTRYGQDLPIIPAKEVQLAFLLVLAMPIQVC